MSNPNETWTEYKGRVCRDLFAKDIAIVSVQFASSRYIRTEQSVYVTLVDKISQFGKCVSTG